MPKKVHCHQWLLLKFSFACLASSCHNPASSCCKPSISLSLFDAPAVIGYTKQRLKMKNIIRLIFIGFSMAFLPFSFSSEVSAQNMIDSIHQDFRNRLFCQIAGSSALENFRNKCTIWIDADNNYSNFRKHVT
jgi:hypothetical protein